jgi:pre-mRNA-splicing factor 18
MDALKAEIASKRKTLQDDLVESSRPTKYMRRGDIEKLKEEQELKAREEKEQKERKEKEWVDQVASLKKAAKMKVCL